MKSQEVIEAIDIFPITNSARIVTAQHAALVTKLRQIPSTICDELAHILIEVDTSQPQNPIEIQTIFYDSLSIITDRLTICFEQVGSINQIMIID